MITKWDVPVANEEICACARPKCRTCSGNGYIHHVYPNERYEVCRCAKARFMRLNKDLISTHEGRFWWRMDPPAGAAEAPPPSAAP